MFKKELEFKDLEKNWLQEILRKSKNITKKIMSYILFLFVFFLRFQLQRPYDETKQGRS